MANVNRLRFQLKTIKNGIAVYEKEFSRPDVSLITLSDKINKYSAFKDEFNEIFFNLVEIVDKDGMPALEAEQEALQLQYYTNLNAAEDTLSKLKSSDDGSENLSRCARTNVRLPQIDLPKFHGTYDAWLEFRDTFVSLVDNNEELGDVQKLQYLKASLKGDALVMISDISTKPANYKIAWDILCNRFDKNSKLVDSHTKALLHLPNCKNGSSEGIHKLIDAVLKNTRALKTLEVPVEYWDTILINLILEKIPDNLVTDWNESNIDNSDIKLTACIKFLERKAEIATKSNNNLRYNKSIINAATTARTNNCILCNEYHYLFNCQKFAAFEHKKKYECVKQNKLCIKCLRPGHILRFCKSKGCAKCGKAHHELMHIESATQSTDKSEAPASSSASSNQVCTNAVCFDHPPGNINKQCHN